VRAPSYTYWIQSDKSNCSLRAIRRMVDLKPQRHGEIFIDCSAIEPFQSYLKTKADEDLDRLASTPGGRLAYQHHRWSSASPRLTIREFWKQQLKRITWSEQLENSIATIIRLLGNREKYWLDATLKYLPEEHVFNTMIYLIGGYDSVVYGENVTLNLNSRQFHRDHREAVYYLIHELAHAGYFRYRRMPKLSGLMTRHRLVETVKLLTHLEGMGVISSFHQRVKQGGLLDPDYQVLLNEKETNRRVREYFSKLQNIQKSTNSKRHKLGYSRLDEFSAKPRRLWYVAGGHMALKIEQECGRPRLQEIVRTGSEEFFGTYLQIENPLTL